MILIDELGRGSVFNETLSVCWAICESLLASSAFTIFATHFIELSALSQVYLNVSNYHFSSEIFEGKRTYYSDALQTFLFALTILFYLNLGNFVCKYPHILLEGPTPERFYGIKLAEMSGLDSAIIEYAKNIALHLSENCTEQTTNEELIERTAKYKMSAMLIHLIIDKKQSFDINLIRCLQHEYEKKTKIVCLQ